MGFHTLSKSKPAKKKTGLPTMNYRFLTPALTEIREAAEFYDNRVSGLGADFLDELDTAIERILSFPEAWGPLGEKYRRCHPLGVSTPLYAKIGLHDGHLSIDLSSLHIDLTGDLAKRIALAQRKLK